MKLNSQKIKSLFLLSLLNSVAGKKAKPKKQTGISSSNSLPKLAANLTEGGENADPTLIFAGYPISLSVDTVKEHFIKYCTAGFMIVNTNSSECLSDSIFWSGNDYGGFLTSSLCWPSEAFGGTLSTNVYSWDGLAFLGSVHYSTLDTNGYTYISSDGTSAVNSKLIPYVVGDNNADGERDLYPVIGLGSVTLGSKVCAYGSISGYLCGNLTETNLEITIPNPWNIIDMSTEILNFQTLDGLGKVDLGVNGFYAEEDLGGPVYTTSNIGNQTIAQALGYIATFDNNDPNHKLLYYMPLDKDLERILDDNNCSYTLMTYNETSAEEFQAQIEIPPKN